MLNKMRKGGIVSAWFGDVRMTRDHLVPAHDPKWLVPIMWGVLIPSLLVVQVLHVLIRCTSVFVLSVGLGLFALARLTYYGARAEITGMRQEFKTWSVD
jgi:hypothetical protein